MYIPILKNRLFENKFLREYPYLFDDQSIIPLIEIISLKIGRTIFDVDSLINYYSSILTSSFLVDFFTFDEIDYKPFSAEQVEFSIYIRDEDKYKYFDDLLYVASKYDKAIPVISITNGREFILSETYIESIIRKLQNECSKIAIRIDAKYFEKYFQLLEDLLREEDYLLYDINELAIESLYFDILAFENKKGNYKSIIINSPRKKNINNDGYKDCQYTQLIDNSIKTSFNEYHFDGFGDYAGLKNILPSVGGNGKGAALGLFYVEHQNKFFSIVNFNKEEGSRGHEYVINQALGPYNNLLDPNKNCPAIEYIRTELHNYGKTGSWGTWKYITILRYISQIKKSTNK